MVCSTHPRSALADQPMYEFMMFTLSDEEHGYVVKFHHLIADGWSIQILAEQVRDCYEQLVANEAPLGEFKRISQRTSSR